MDQHLDRRTDISPYGSNWDAQGHSELFVFFGKGTLVGSFFCKVSIEFYFVTSWKVVVLPLSAAGKIQLLSLISIKIHTTPIEISSLYIFDRLKQVQNRIFQRSFS